MKIADLHIADNNVWKYFITIKSILMTKNIVLMSGYWSISIHISVDYDIIHRKKFSLEVWMIIEAIINDHFQFKRNFNKTKIKNIFLN